MLHLLLTAIFGVHLLAVDLAMAGPLIAIWLEWRESRHQDLAAGAVGQRLIVWSLAATALGIGLGLLALVLLPGGDADPYRRTIAGLPALRWWFIAIELTFSLVAMGAYWWLWKHTLRRRSWQRLLHRLLAAAASTNFMYHFPPLFVVIATLSLRGQPWTEDRSRFRQMLLEGDVLSRVVHHWLAAVAVAAAVAMLIAQHNATVYQAWEKLAPGSTAKLIGMLRYLRNEQITRSDNWQSFVAQLNSLVRGAARIGLTVTMLQIPAGIWLLLAMPEALQSQLLGENLLATGLFGVSMIFAFSLMHHLTMVVLGAPGPAVVRRAAVLLAATVVLMAAALQFAQQPIFDQIKQREHVAEFVKIPRAADNPRIFTNSATR